MVNNAGMWSGRLAGLTILMLVAGCNFESKPAARAPERSDATPPSAAPAEGTPSSGHPAPLPLAKKPPPKLPTIPWTPQADRQQHLQYHWPADFKLPIEIEMRPPKVPREIQGPSPPIKPAS